MIGGERGGEGEIAEINWRWEGEMGRWGGEKEGVGRRKIKIIESNAKCCYLKKITCKGRCLSV